MAIAGLTPEMADALQQGWPRLLLAEIDHPSGTFYGWSGLGILDYDGHQWTGLGVLGKVAPVKSSSELAIQEITFTLSGLRPEELALLDEVVQGRTGLLWLACLDPAGNVVRHPWLQLDATLDYQSFNTSESGEVSVQVVGHSGFRTLERTLDEVWSPEDQKSRFPDDTGLDDLPFLQNQEITWTKNPV